MTFFLVLLIVAVLSGAYQRHRVKTQFYLKQNREGETIELRLMRRFGYKWPSTLLEDLEFSKKDSYYSRNFSNHQVDFPRSERTYFTLAKIKASDDDASEKMIEAVVNTKSQIPKWTGQHSAAKRLSKQTQKAIKR